MLPLNLTKTIPRPQFTYIDPMKAVVLEGKDLPLVVRDVPKPLPTPGMAVVRIIAASLNHRDVWISMGQYAGIEYPLVPGSDGVGVVEAVARNVDPNWIGKQVIINPSHQWGASEAAQGDGFKILGLPDQGTLAELVAVPVEYLHELPQHLTAEQGSALPLAV
jgi:zinc-binding alcohol dehydrogenase/oxidoreductase